MATKLTLLQRRALRAKAREERKQAREVARQARRTALAASRKNKVVVASHNINSNALKELAGELSKRLGYTVYRVKPERVLGRRSITFHPGINKIEQFRSFTRAAASCPAFATTMDEAKQLPGKLVVVRSLVSASEGRGIQIVNKEELTQQAPLYTEYIPKKKEFRVHVLNNKVIDVQEKRKRTGGEQKEFQVRNTANGYVFCRGNIVPPDDLHSVALAAVAAIGRSQGAVDIIWNEKQNKCFALEVNSRPGMAGLTVKLYAEAILEYLNGNA